MAELTPAISVDNIFNLGIMFGLDRAETAEAKQFTTRFDADGNYLCSREHDLVTNYTQDFNHCAASNGVVTDIDALLSDFGEIVTGDAGAVLATSVELTFESGVGATGSITGHQHGKIGRAHV